MMRSHHSWSSAAPTTRWLFSSLLVVALVVAACSEDDPTTPPPSSQGGDNTGLSGGGGGSSSCDDLGGTTCDAAQFCAGAWLDDGCCDQPCKAIPSCDGEPMVRPPDGFLSVDVYEIRHSHGSELFEEAARRMGEAHVARVKKPLMWHHVEPTTNDGWDDVALDKYEALFQAYADNGVEVEIELIGTPRWASSCDGNPQYPGLDCSQVGVAAGFPPTSMDDWRDYVTTMVDRYKGFTNRWAIWAEPDREDMWRGTPADYIAHLDEARAIIASRDPDAEVLSPQMNVGSWVWDEPFWSDLDNNHFRRWLEALAQDGDYDVFSIHILLEEDVAGIVHNYTQVRQLLDSYGKQATPITVSSTQLLGAFPALPNKPRDLQCPYIDKTTHEALPEAAQAAMLTQIYACLANAGAQGVSWYRISDLDASSWFQPCPGDGCNCDDSANPPVDACPCDNPDPNLCNFWCPPDGIDRSGILHPYDNEQPAGQRYATKAAYDAVQLIGEYLLSPP